MNSTTTRQMQPETLDTLNNLIAQWNRDSISLNTTLVITGNQFSIINERILETLPSTENTQEENNVDISLPTEPDSYEQLLAEIDFNSDYLMKK